MQHYSGLYIDTYSVTQEYDLDDLYKLGHDTAERIGLKIKQAGRPASFTPQLALVLFTEPVLADNSCRPDPGDPMRPPKMLTRKLQDLCTGINDGLCLWEGNPVPLVGCSVASIPDIETCKLHTQAFTIMILVSKRINYET
jgi:hypothetical protein